MILSLVAIAFNSLVLLIAPFAILGIYIYSCLILRRPISNTLLSVTALMAVLVATLHFSVTYLLPSVGTAALVYFGSTALVLGAALLESPLQKLKEALHRFREWIMRASAAEA